MFDTVNLLFCERKKGTLWCMENQNEIAIRIKVLVYYSKLHYALLNGHFIYVVILSLLCLHFPAFSILRFVFVRLFFLPHCFTDILHCEVCVLVCRRFLWMTYFGKTCGLCVCVLYCIAWFSYYRTFFWNCSNCVRCENLNDEIMRIRNSIIAHSSCAQLL